ncbi:MAG: hypothetical protein ACE368_20125 [Paracoccaceae bacterium]
MTHSRRIALALAAGAAMLAAPVDAVAGTVTANCTGMLNLDIYEIDTERDTQDVAGIGTSEVTVSEDEIVLTGAFGSYRFDLKAGTLYHNDSDTGVYCTYKGLGG